MLLAALLVTHPQVLLMSSLQTEEKSKPPLQRQWVITIMVHSWKPNMGRNRLERAVKWKRCHFYNLRLSRPGPHVVNTTPRRGGREGGREAWTWDNCGWTSSNSRRKGPVLMFELEQTGSSASSQRLSKNKCQNPETWEWMASWWKQASLVSIETRKERLWSSCCWWAADEVLMSSVTRHQHKASTERTQSTVKNSHCLCKEKKHEGNFANLLF